ncbi:MAG: membrane protein insertase YidC [Nitrospirota bacterium]
MEKRTLVAIVLSIAILLAWQYFFVPQTPPAPQQKAAQEQARQEAAKAPSAVPAAPAMAPLPPTDTASPEKEIKVENNLYAAVFTSRGGTIKSITLKNYTDKKGNPIVLKGDSLIAPLSIGATDEFQYANAPFAVRGENVTLSPDKNAATIVFEYSAGSQSIRRTYTFHYDKYGFDLRDEVQGLGSYWITPGRDFGIYEKSNSAHSGPVILKDAERLEFTGAKLKETKSFKEGIKWVAQEDKYFFSAIVPKTQTEEAKVWAKNTDALAALRMPAGTNNYFIYAGPKELPRLSKLGNGLEHIVDFGFFSIIARPLFWILKFFYDLTLNYGIAIIILTILVRIPFIPLINKGQKSMKKLQDIQPRMAEIREKYKSDPQRMQRELMELYKKNKVNPMGGCLPMLLQIPVFFALYQVLNIAIELRGAPFMLWIQDLAAKDPYYILPIIMGITMVIQQKMTPSTMDPTQQKIMMLMPVVFTFMFLTFPSGLVLYWLVNNVLSIAQQWYMNKKLVKQPA